MGVIGPRETTVEVCPTCGLDVREGEHATSSHQNDATVEVEYVRADLHRGAVEAIRAHRERWVKANGDRNLEGNARPADLELWAVLDRIGGQ
jgi:hypothetical protein